MRAKLYKLLALLTTIAVLTTTVTVGLFVYAAPEETNLLADLSLSAETGVQVDKTHNGVTVTGNTETYFNGLTLGKNATYVYEFTMTLHESLAANLPTLVLRGGTGGQYLAFWSSLDQVRVAANSGGDPFVEIFNPFGLKADTPMAFKIILEPTRLQIWVDGQVKKPQAGVADAEGWIPMEAVENGKIGISAMSGVPNFTLSDLKLTQTDSGPSSGVADAQAAIDAIGTVDAYSREKIDAARRLFDALSEEEQGKVGNKAVLEAAEAAFEQRNLLRGLSLSSQSGVQLDAANNGITVTGNTETYFNGLTLSKNATYVYEFTMTLNDTLTNNLPSLALRASTKGQYLAFWSTMDQVRAADTSGGDPFVEIFNPFGLKADTPMAFKIILEPERFQVWVDGQVKKPQAGVADAEGWIPMAAVENGKIGISAMSGVPNFTLSKLSLTLADEGAAVKVADVEEAIGAIGTVNAYSREKIEAARLLYDGLSSEEQALVSNAALLTQAEAAFAALNLLQGKTLEGAGTNVTFQEGILHVNGTAETPVLFQDLTLHRAYTYVYEFHLTFNGSLANNLMTLGLRDGAAGQYISFWSTMDQVRIAQNKDGDPFTEIYNPFGLSADVPLAFKILLEPERIQIWVNGQVMKPHGGKADAEGWIPLQAVENGRLGFYATGGTPDFTLSAMSLTLDDADILPARQVDALIDAIGAVTLDSGNAIEAAEAAYARLTEAQKRYVEHAAQLTAARQTYDRLVAEHEASQADKEKADAVTRLIDAIGAVTLDSAGAIEAAQQAYDALTDAQKLLVANGDALTAAKRRFADLTAAKRVDDLIDAIGAVTASSAEKIQAARDAYNRLTAAQKELVTRLSALLQAEKELAALNGSADVYYYYPTTADAMGVIHWNTVTLSDRETGGIHYAFNGAGTDWRTGVKRPMRLDGAHMVFDNLRFTSENKKFALLLADLDPDEMYTSSGKKPLILIFNCETGELKVTSESAAQAGETILQSEALKAENLNGRVLDIRFQADKTGGYTVTLLGQSGAITKAMIEAAAGLTDYENVYLTLCPWDWGASVKMEMDLVAIHGGQSICADDLSDEQIRAINAAIALIREIGEVTLDSKAKIEAARAAYDALGTAEQGLVSNYKVLTTAEWKLGALEAVDRDYLDKHYYKPSTDRIMGTNYWVDNLFISQAAAGGIHFNWNKAGTDWRIGVEKAMKLDGLHLVFSNPQFKSANKRFVVYLCDLRDGLEDWGAKYCSYSNLPLAIVFDLNNGVVKVCSEQVSDPAGTVLIESPALLAENLEGKDFDLKMKANPDGTYTLSVMGLEAVITKKMLSEAAGLTKYDEVYMTLCPWDWAASTVLDMDLVAMHGGEEICADEVTDEEIGAVNQVIETIRSIFNAQGQVTMASASAIQKARAAYQALDDFLKGIVENYQDLLYAEEVFDLVEAIDNIGTVTLEKTEAIQTLDMLYKGLDPLKRPMVGNYLTLRDALLKAYELKKGTAPGDTTSSGTPSSEPGNASSPGTGETTRRLGVSLLLALAVCGALLTAKRKSAKAL